MLDKTGTLTEGRPAVREVVPSDTGVSEDEVLDVAAAAESPSQHPLARAVVDAARARGLGVAEAEGFGSVTGFGVEATVGSRHILVGRPELLADRGVDTAPVAAAIERLQEAGRTVAVVAVDGAVLGAIGLGEVLRQDAVEAGDNERAARIIADRAAIEDVYAGVLPDAKAQIVRQLQADGARVAMVGDGIDAPALMQTDVGVAMGGGTDMPWSRPT